MVIYSNAYDSWRNYFYTGWISEKNVFKFLLNLKNVIFVSVEGVFQIFSVDLMARKPNPFSRWYIYLINDFYFCRILAILLKDHFHKCLKLTFSIYINLFLLLYQYKLFKFSGKNLYEKFDKNFILSRNIFVFV